MKGARDERNEREKDGLEAYVERLPYTGSSIIQVRATVRVRSEECRRTFLQGIGEDDEWTEGEHGCHEGVDRKGEEHR